MKQLLISILLLFLVACSSSYQAAKNSKTNSIGYYEIRLNKGSVPERYLLTYRGRSSDDPIVNTQHWHRRALALCLQNYHVNNHYQRIEQEPFKSPVNGIMITFYRRIPVDKGEISCK